MSNHFCRQCGSRVSLRKHGGRRGLCRHCYHSRDTRPAEPAIAATPPPAADPTEPTAGYPGSEAKIQVLELRQAGGFPLWHNLDAPLAAQADRPTQLPLGLTAAELQALRIREPTPLHVSPPDPI